MRLGIDIGGTKIEAAAIDANGRERFRRRIATPHGEYPQALDALVAHIAAAEKEAGAEPHSAPALWPSASVQPGRRPRGRRGGADRS